ncbi:MAG TPA: aminotransferase class I/II-fold pyridoxal phosphate-dependent enzyme [Acidimicrobiales bacterium]|nr:aminotransferase class I/II-fold pyridoxal phosphate-dependent enzyme [Acidimicrobiales bacterium]
MSAPPVGPRTPLVVGPGVRNLLAGSPDPALLPEIPTVSPPRRAYDASAVTPRLARLAAERFEADRIDPANLAVVGGALDGVERVLGAWLRPGDRVAVEDPGYTAVIDLISALAYVAVPMEMDAFGVKPASLASALASGVGAVVMTPRAQNPTGSAWDSDRARGLRRVLSRQEDVLVVEDDHAGPIAGAPAFTTCRSRGRWATIRSVSKSLGPDLRLATVAGDEATIARLEGRQALGTGWVSYVLQEIVAELWDDSATEQLLARAEASYTTRRRHLIDALSAHGIEASCRSGLTAWVPVADEAGVVASLLERGWAVAPGERFRIASPPAIRVGLATLSDRESWQLAGALAEVRKLRPRRSD